MPGGRGSRNGHLLPGVVELPCGVLAIPPLPGERGGVDSPEATGVRGAGGKFGEDMADSGSELRGCRRPEAALIT